MMPLLATTWDESDGGPFRSGEWANENLSGARPAPLIVAPERPIPLIAVRHYAQLAAQRHSRSKCYDDGTWWVEAPDLPGTFGEGLSEDEAMADLVDVIYVWAIAKIEDRDGDIPVIPGAFDLNSI